MKKSDELPAWRQLWFQALQANPFRVETAMPPDVVHAKLEPSAAPRHAPLRFEMVQ